MDIQKEREAFEATQNPIVFERIVYIEKANLFTMKDDFRDDLFTVNKCNELNFGWSSWQAAKAHEAEKLKGCVVVPVEPTREIREAMYMAQHYHMAVVNPDEWDAVDKSYKAMVEAARGGNE